MNIVKIWRSFTPTLVTSNSSSKYKFTGAVLQLQTCQISLKGLFSAHSLIDSEEQQQEITHMEDICIPTDTCCVQAIVNSLSFGRKFQSKCRGKCEGR